MRKSAQDSDEQNRRTNQVQSDRITELVAARNQFEQQLSVQKQTNQVLNDQITHLKSTIVNIEEDKKLWKETLNNLREQCNDLSGKLSETQKSSQTLLTDKESQIHTLQNEIETLKSKFMLSLKEKEESKKYLEELHKSKLSDIHDLKTLLSASLQSERKLKKTILELNDVVNKQNKNIVAYKQEIQELSKKVKVTENDHRREREMNTGLQQKVQSMQQSNTALQVVNNDLNAQLEANKSRLSELENENARLKQMESELQSKLQQTTTELDALRDKVRVKTVMLNDQNETILALKSEKAELQKQVDCYAAKEKELTEKQNELLAEIEELQSQLGEDFKEELESYKNKANKYYDAYQDTKEKLAEKEEQLQYVSNEVQEMEKMWQKEKKGIKEKYDDKLREKEEKINEIESELTSTKQQLNVSENKLNSEKLCRQKWEKKCAQINAQKVETEQEMRLILTEMQRYKQTAAQFAKMFNV